MQHSFTPASVLVLIMRCPGMLELEMMICN